MKTLKPNSGISLIEITCALFIVTVAGFGALQLYNVGFDKILEMQEIDLALEVVRNEMELIHAQPFATMESHDTLTGNPPVLESLHKATGSVHVSDAGPGLKEVTVILRWQSRHGRMMDRSLTTYIADRGATP